MPNITVTRQLNLNVTTSATWAAMLNLSTLSPYYVALGGRALVNSIRFQNAAAAAVSVEVAVSPTEGGITANRMVVIPTSINASTTWTLGECVVVPGGHALWIRATGTPVDLTVSAPCLEYVISAVDPQIIVPSATIPYVAETWLVVGTIDLTGYQVIIVLANASGDFGIYVSIVTADAADGSLIIQDLVGNKFKLRQ